MNYEDKGYTLISWFELSWRIWLDQYYIPLQKVIVKIQEKAIYNAKLNPVLLKAQDELEVFRKNPEENESVFYIMQKANKPW